MIWILYISALIVAVAFAVLVIFIVQTLKSLRITLDNVATTVDSLEKQLNGITVETTELLHKTNKLAEDIQEKSLALNSVVDRVKDVGNSLGTLNQSFRNISNQVVAGSERYSEQVEKAVEWTGALMRVWQQWKVKKKATDQYIGVEEK